jgi:hypothetical protein
VSNGDRGNGGSDGDGPLLIGIGALAVLGLAAFLYVYFTWMRPWRLSWPFLPYTP